jgi:hypothetical protein
MMRTDRLALLAVAGVASLAVVLATMHAIQPGLSPVAHFVSEYAHGQLGWLVTLGYVLAGAGTLVLAWRLVAQLGSGRWALASAACLASVSVGLVATGLTRIDIAHADGTVNSTVSGQIHELASYIAVLGLIAAGFAIPATFRRDPCPLGGSSVFRLYGWTMLAAFAGTLVAQRLDMIGLGQRVFLAVAISWLMYVGIRVSGVPLRAARTAVGRSPGLVRREDTERAR